MVFDFFVVVLLCALGFSFICIEISSAICRLNRSVTNTPFYVTNKLFFVTNEVHPLRRLTYAALFSE